MGDRRWTHGTGVLVTALASARTRGPLHHVKEGAPVPAGAVVLMPPPPAGDASGTVAVMELAAALAAGPRPKRTIVFGLFGSEEAVGFGAGYFVDKPRSGVGETGRPSRT